METILTVIPADKSAAVKTALLQAFQTEEPESIEILSGGLSTALVYKIGIRGKHYLLRLVMEVNAMNDPKRQFTCLRLAASAEIAPKVYYTSVTDGISITDFIYTQPQTDKTNLLHELATTAKKIHELPLFPSFMNFLEGIDLFIVGFKASGLFSATATAELFALYHKIRTTYHWQEVDLVSSHNDLNPNNILFDGAKSWIIDWEAAFLNDRYVDLAIIAQSYARKPEQQHLLLKTYFDAEPTDYQKARFFLMQQVCLLYYGLMMFRLVTDHVVTDTDLSAPSPEDFYALLAGGQVSLNNAEGQLQYGKVLFNQLLINLRSQKFEEALELLS
ncbi:phosphotransferase [Mucilaginibacter corticis]|uniref:Phosphotransferase n=1 Tax=Mucilaginibacter corticis TaxID=2597670 RepID=A0A556MRS9_9SPHI|nr:phosphotransferase [Mucilaginibacter corticis]TSJ42613.1 phosphotransferase [Mucilaginibacter corticis]